MTNQTDGARSVHAAIAELARQLHASEQRDLQAVLANVAEGAVSNMPGAEYAGITITTNRDTLTTQVATDPIAELHNDIQIKHGQGPCLVAAWDQPVVRVNDLTSETRWPAYAADAVALTPFRSLLSFRLYTHTRRWVR